MDNKNAVITCLIIAVTLMSLVSPLRGSGEAGASGTGRIASSALSTYLVETGYALDEDFSGGLDWHVQKTHGSCIVQVSNGELELKSYGLATQTAWHELNVSKQDYTLSMNYRVEDDLGAPYIGNIFNVFAGFGRDWPVYGAPVYEAVPLVIWQLVNGSLEIDHDDGTLWYVPTLAYTYTPVLSFDTNYQITVRVWGWNDTARVQVYNKSSSSYIFQSGELSTFRTHADRWTPCYIPERMYVGDAYGYGGQRWFHAFWDNITITFDKADHAGTALNEYGVEQAVEAFGAAISDTEYSPGRWRLAYDTRQSTWETLPGTYLTANDYEHSRDDVAGEMIEVLCMLYEYYGVDEYLEQAQEMWAALSTHRQSDGGFTFGLENADYVDTDARIVLGLLALYRTTGNNTYLEEVAETIDSMYAYQNSTGHVAGRHNRDPSVYWQNEEAWFGSFFAIALLEASKYIPDTEYLTKAELTLDWLCNRQSDSGRMPNAPWVSGFSSPDFNDVVQTGCSLWALSLGYKVTGDTEYLHHAELAANYIVNSEFTKGTVSTGLWCGTTKDRYNQSDLVYTWPVIAGLASYRTAVPSDTAALLALYAGINRLVSIQGAVANVNGATLYGMTGMWAGSWNMNSTDSQGWTMGYFAEGGWGTWGLVAFYGWQCAVVRAMIDVIADAEEEGIYVRSGCSIKEDGTVQNMDLTGSTEHVNLTVSVEALTFLLVTAYDDGDTLLAMNISAAEGTATFTLGGGNVTAGRSYALYVDGLQEDGHIAAGEDGELSFSYSGSWSSHELELRISMTQLMSDLLMPFIGIIFAVGIIAALVGGMAGMARAGKQR